MLRFILTLTRCVLRPVLQSFALAKKELQQQVAALKQDKMALEGRVQELTSRQTQLER